VGAPDGAPEGAPDGAPEGAPDAAWQFCWEELPLFEFEVDDESPEPHAVSSMGAAARRATAGRRRTRFMRNSSKNDEEVEACMQSTPLRAPVGSSCAPPVRTAKPASTHPT
jgi:hypothetical protein